MSTERSKENMKATKRDKSVRGVQNTVSNFQAGIDCLPVERDKKNTAFQVAAKSRLPKTTQWGVSGFKDKISW